MTTQEALTSIAQVLIRNRFPTAGVTYTPTRDEIISAVDRCAPLLNADRRSQTAAFNELFTRYGHDTAAVWR